MSEPQSRQTYPSRVSRRTVVQGVAWATPAIAFASAAPAFAASPMPSLELVNQVALADYQGGVNSLDSLGGAERYYKAGANYPAEDRGNNKNNDFRYSFRVRNNGTSGMLTGPIYITFEIPYAAKINQFKQPRNSYTIDVTNFMTPTSIVDKHTNSTGGVNSQQWAIEPVSAPFTATRASGNSDTRVSQERTVTLRLTFTEGNGLAVGEFAQASVYFEIDERLARPVRGSNDNLIEGIMPGNGNALTWYSAITAHTPQTPVLQGSDTTTAGETGFGMWYFDGGCDRPYGVPGSDTPTCSF